MNDRLELREPPPSATVSWWICPPEQFASVAAAELERRMRFVKYPATLALDGVESAGDAGYVPKSSRTARRFFGAPACVRFGGDPDFRFEAGE